MSAYTTLLLLFVIILTAWLSVLFVQLVSLLSALTKYVQSKTMYNLREVPPDKLQQRKKAGEV